MSPISGIASQKQQRLSVGIWLVVGAGVTLASMDALSKYLSAEINIVQIVWARYFFHSLIVSAVLLRKGSANFLYSRQPGKQFVRAACLFGATLCMYTALTRIPLADATAVQFFAPVLVSLISIPILKEKARASRIGAVVVGFLAVLLIIRPGPSTDPYTLLPLGTAVLLSVYFLLTRLLAGRDHINTTQFYTTAIGALVLTLVVPFIWESTTFDQFLVMMTIGAFGALGHFAIIKGFAHAPASILSPFLYSQILFAAALSVIFFGDALTIHTISGASLLVASGLYLWWTERRG
jgi:drug/metabolite transporter (DMT)-like permease